jgi:hypothetical protein
MIFRKRVKFDGTESFFSGTVQPRLIKIACKQARSEKREVSFHFSVVAFKTKPKMHIAMPREKRNFLSGAFYF